MRRSVKLVGCAWLASAAWLGCNAILGNESAEFVPDAGARDDATTPTDGNGSNGDATIVDANMRPDAGFDAEPFEAGACDGVDIDASPTNCGRCGHDCLGGACTAGVCQPIVLATDRPGPRVLTRDGDFLYWVNGRSGDVSRVLVDGGSQQLLYAGLDAGSGESVAFDGPDFYYPTGTLDGGIVACPKTGCTGAAVAVVANLEGPTSVSITPERELYFTELANRRVAHCTLPCTGPITALTTTDTLPDHVAADGAGVYWTAFAPTASLRGREGNDPIRTVREEFIGEVRLQRDEVWWAARGGGPQAAPRDGGARRVLRPTPGENQGTQGEHLDVVGDSVFFTETTTTRAAIYVCPRAGCRPDEPPIYLGRGTPRGVTGDERMIYWADERTPDGNGAIFRLAR